MQFVYYRLNKHNSHSRWRSWYNEELTNWTIPGSIPGRDKVFLFSIVPRPAQGSTQAPVNR
jgi:hypothetical protein